MLLILGSTAACGTSETANATNAGKKSEPGGSAEALPGTAVKPGAAAKPVDEKKAEQVAGKAAEKAANDGLKRYRLTGFSAELPVAWKVDVQDKGSLIAQGPGDEGAMVMRSRGKRPGSQEQCAAEGKRMATATRSTLDGAKFIEKDGTDPLCAVSLRNDKLASLTVLYELNDRERVTAMCTFSAKATQRPESCRTLINGLRIER